MVLSKDDDYVTNFSWSHFLSVTAVKLHYFKSVDDRPLHGQYLQFFVKIHYYQYYVLFYSVTLYATVCIETRQLGGRFITAHKRTSVKEI